MLQQRSLEALEGSQKVADSVWASAWVSFGSAYAFSFYYPHTIVGIRALPG